MKILRTLFCDHPASVGETYFQHLCSATSFSTRMLLGGIACFIHGLLPFLFVRTGSQSVAGLYDRMITNRDRRKPQVTPGTTPSSAKPAGIA